MFRGGREGEAIGRIYKLTKRMTEEDKNTGGGDSQKSNTEERG